MGYQLPADVVKRIDAVYDGLFRSAPKNQYGSLDYAQQRDIREKAQRKVLIGRASAIDFGPLVPKLKAGDAKTMTEAAEQIAAAACVTLVWRHGDLFPDSVGAFARIEQREPHVPILTDGAVDDFARVLHEIGHCLAEPHQGADHVKDASTTWLRCLMCEGAAWEIALTLSPECLLGAVHAQAGRSLARYSDSTPGTREAFRRVERVRGRLGLNLAKHDRRMREMGMEMTQR